MKMMDDHIAECLAAREKHGNHPVASIDSDGDTVIGLNLEFDDDATVFDADSDSGDDYEGPAYIIGGD